MKFRKITAVITAVVMALSMATAASANAVSYGDHIGYTVTDNDNSMAAYSIENIMRQLLAEYPNGSYYTHSGGPCTCHGWCEYYSNCNCVKYDASTQCVAFAKYVFYNLRGYKWSNGTTTYKSVSNVTATSAKNALSGIPTGSYVAITTASGSFHCFSYINSDANSITLYDANSNKNCNVRYVKMSWTEFANNVSYIEKVVS